MSTKIKAALEAATLTGGIILGAFALSAILPHAADADTVPVVQAVADADLAHEAGVQAGYAMAFDDLTAEADAQAARVAEENAAAQAAQAAEIARLTAALAVKPTTVTKTVKVPVPAKIPVCHEDEAVTPDGLCVPMDGADYVGGIGWVPLPGTKTHPSLA
jgi:hypothetical protein